MQTQYDQSKLDTRFDRESESWKKLYEPARTNLFKYQDKIYRQNYALELLGNGPGTILDLGCGSGSYFQFLEELGYQVVGLDSSSNMVESASSAAQQLKNSSVIRGNALQLPFADNTFDALLGVGLLEYLPSDEEFLEKVERIMKPGGRVVLTLRNARCLERRLWEFYRKVGFDIYRADYYYREHNPRDFEPLLSSMSFQNIQRRFCHFYPFPWPMSKLLKPLNACLAHKMESWFSKSVTDSLGSTYLVAFDLPEHESQGQKTEYQSLLDYCICPSTGQPLKKLGPSILGQLNAKIANGELRNQNNESIGSPLDDAYITEDGRLVYPIKKQVPILSVEESIVIESDARSTKAHLHRSPLKADVA